MYLLIGGSGGPNYGDELMVRGWLEYLSNEFENIKVEVNIKKNAEEFHNNKNVMFSEDIKKIAKKFSNLNFWQQVARGFNFFERGGVKNNSEINFDYLDKVKIVHLHGGGYVNENAPVNGFLLGFCAALRKRSKIKVIATGIGLMPISSPPQERRELLNDVLSNYDAFELRDHESYFFLKSNLSHARNISLGLDDSFILSKNEVLKINEDKKVRTLYLSFAEYNLKSFTEGYWQELKKFSEKYDEVVFWECFPWKDKDVFQSMKETFPNIRLASAKNITYLKEEFSRNDFLVTSRFHPHLVSARSGLNGVFYSSGKYYDVKHQSVVAVGSPFFEGSYNNFKHEEDLVRNFLTDKSQVLNDVKVCSYKSMVV